MENEKLDLHSPVLIYALGGLGEVGKNMYCIEDSESIVIMDCGVLFPSDAMPGVDYIIPDFSHLKENGIFCFSFQLGANEDFVDEPYLKENGRMYYKSHC